MEEGNQSRIEITVPMAIIIAGIFIAAAIMMSRGSAPVVPTNQIEAPKAADIKIRAVDSSDHIRGSAAALVKVVVFSDPEFPFCKRFHSTMKQVMDKYSTSGQVAWVYRNFPLD